jgi:Flp pilus assembly protein TadD
MTAKTIRIAASALALGLSTIGCQYDGDTDRPLSWSQDATRSERKAQDIYEQALAKAQAGENDAALELAEKAVELAPRNAGYRMVLAELYLRVGRLASAERTFADTVILHPDNSRAGIYLGLTRAAQGQGLAALSALEKLEGQASASDLGLAFALAGDPQRAIALLEPAARQHGADARVRQNLALAYALAGDWGKARVTAAQDVSPADLEQRMENWASLARPETGNSRIAAFLGVTPVEDAGQPSRLALSVPEVQTEAYAAAAVPAPVAVEPVQPEMPVVQQASYTLPPEAPAAVEPPPLTMQAIAPQVAPQPFRAVASSGRYVMQIGAYGSRAQAETAWKAAQRRFGFSSDRQVITTVISADGKSFHRLAVQGFGTAAEATRACKAVKAKGGDCFVRALGGGSSAKIAARR